MAAQVPLDVAPLIRGARWAFLIAGITYGFTRYSILSRAERKRLAELERTRPEREAKQAAENKRKLEEELREIENLISASSPPAV